MLRSKSGRLPSDASILGFTNDPSGRFLVAYAGPCPERDCDSDHRRLYLLPMIGWFHFDDEYSNMILRPAIMTGNGSTVDYLDLPSGFTFIAVLEDGDDTVIKAVEIYRQQHAHQGAEIELDEVETVLTN